MQAYDSKPSRNQSSAAAIPSKVSVPPHAAPKATPSTGTGHSSGSAVKGFAGSLKPGKV